MATPQLGVALRTDIGDLFVSRAAGGSMKLFSGAVPANCQAADPAGELVDEALPSPALTNTTGVLTKAGTWAFTGAAAGTAASGRLYTSGGVCFFQGAVSATGGGTVFEIDNTSIAIGQNGTVTSVTITVGGA
jgi:hypothetical protein